ncbi:MAG: quinolinate synthase NadA [Promethearchaeota archaeon]
MTRRTIEELQDRIRKLKEEQGVLLCAHYYQALEIQDVADVVGDSLMLSRVARDNPQDTIVFAAVKFMAETASILSPDKHVLLPDSGAKCPMAAFAPAKLVREYKEKFPGVPVVLYVNSVAEAKAECDVVCTSSNAVRVVERLVEDTGAERVLFGPDANLARWVKEKTGIDIEFLPPEGYCNVHERFHLENYRELIEKKPGSSARLIVHPECNKELADNAEFVGSTAQLWKYMEEFEPAGQTFVVGTEVNFVKKAARDIPAHEILPLRESAFCGAMARTTLEKVLEVLEKPGETDRWEVKVPEEVATRASAAIEKMMDYS